MLPDSPGYFEIHRVGREISYEEFYAQYFIPEVPVVIEQLGKDWPACKKWSRSYLQERLANEPSVCDVILFLQLGWDVMSEDFTIPDIINSLDLSPDVLDHDHNAIMWVN